MSDDQFTKLFKYIQEFRKEMLDKFDQNAAQHNTIFGELDTLAKQSEAHEQERLFANHQIDRQRDWIVQIAKNTNTKLDPEP